MSSLTSEVFKAQIFEHWSELARLLGSMLLVKSHLPFLGGELFGVLYSQQTKTNYSKHIVKTDHSRASLNHS